MRQNVLDRIPQMAEITVPTNYIDWKSRQLNLPSNTKEQNQWPANSPREPHYVLVRSDEAVPQRLGELMMTFLCFLFSFFFAANLFLLSLEPLWNDMVVCLLFAILDSNLLKSRLLFSERFRKKV